MNITNEMINEIRNKIDIVEIISKYIHLTPRGKNYFGVCPFHDDHSPSMSVSKEKQIYTCFSCGATGNVFTFISEYEHIGFYDAVRLLGQQLGYKIRNVNTVKNKDNEAYEIYELATKFYQNSLTTTYGKNANEYLAKRQIDKDTIKKFKIGLSVSKTSLTDYLLGTGKTLKQLIDLGLSNESGTDLFNNRIMFPLFDLEGRIVGFSGRIYNTKEGSKYVNTKETSIFKKGNILYNYHNAKEKLKKNQSIIVMEGFMDVIRASSVGITNCIATMGTALTKQNASLLKKMANEIILCFDGDKAGEEATISAINILKEIDISPKVVRLEEDLDPDEYILKYGVDKFQSKINNPTSSIEFMMEQHKNNKNLTNIEDITKYINESLNDLISIEDSILVELTLKKMSVEYKVDYEILKNKYKELKNKIKPKKESIINETNRQTKKYNQCEIASRNLLYYMIKDEKVLIKVEKEITFFPDNIIRVLANEMIYFYHKYGILNIADFISYIESNEEEKKLFNEIINLNITKKYNLEEIEDYIKVINSYQQKKKEEVLKEEIKKEIDPIKQAKILSEILALKGVKQ